jgi:predicted Zn-ribbon and HTH transcriptional regulator
VRRSYYARPGPCRPGIDAARPAAGTGFGGARGEARPQLEPRPNPRYPEGVAAPRDERPPAERSVTVRDALLRHLREGPRTARELSGLVGIPEKQVADHLAHVARSLRSTAERLRVEPARCLGCGFVFRKRDRLDRPSACPVCRGQRLGPPRFGVGPA